MYYNYHKILSYNAFINILIGERRRSEKLTGASKMVIQRFLKKNEQFAYIRRYKPELKKAVPNFLTGQETTHHHKQCLLHLFFL